MRKILFLLIAFIAIGFTSCNFGAKSFGGKQTIELKPGEKLVEVTWKDYNIWYLVEPMEDDYVPKTKVFKEDSNAGVLEGEVVFIETR